MLSIHCGTVSSNDVQSQPQICVQLNQMPAPHQHDAGHLRLAIMLLQSVEDYDTDLLADKPVIMVCCARPVYISDETMHDQCTFQMKPCTTSGHFR